MARLASQWARTDASSIALGLDDSHHPLAEAFVRHPDHGAGDDARCVQQDPLDLGRIDVGTAPDDDEALAVAEVEVAAVVEEADVAGVELAARQRARPTASGRSQ